MSDYEDPDYVPEEAEESEATSEEEETWIAPPPSKKQKFVATLTTDERNYFYRLPENEKWTLIHKHEDVRNANESYAEPIRFKVLNSDMSVNTKRIILSRLEHFQMMRDGNGEYFKLRNWFNSLCRMPFGKYKTLPVTKDSSVDNIACYLRGVKHSLDNTVYGHQEAKDKIVQILAQWISNPLSKGNCIGIHGSMGVGKTMLVKEGICKALDLPFGFIALGGASDASYLDGHSFTYEGSTYGKIAEVLMKTQVMNPVLFFDELDKVSNSHRGEEIVGVLTHLTDSSQNERFCDKYFGEIELDLSKALIVFSYNDESLINPILKDRMVTIKVSGYTNKDKMVICKKHLVPSILQQFGFAEGDIVIGDDVLDYIISILPDEDGVRNLKRGLETVVSWVNLLRYMSEKNIVYEVPFTITIEQAKKCLKNKSFVGKNVATNYGVSMMYV